MVTVAPGIHVALVEARLSKKPLLARQRRYTAIADAKSIAIVVPGGVGLILLVEVSGGAAAARVVGPRGTQ